MNFARKQLEKYGWTEGKGLGKNENGIVKAIKPKLKFDNAGFGHDKGEQFTYHWWENVYNQAANNINIKRTDNSVVVELNSDKSVNITTSKYCKLKNDDNTMEYGKFLKKSKLVQNDLVQLNMDDDSDDNSHLDEPKANNSGITMLTDEQLFAACGGRTAHKGARHGLTLKGKLARIEEQERQLLNEQLSKQTNTMSIDKQLPENSTKSSGKKNKRTKCPHCKHRKCRCNVFTSQEDDVKKKKKSSKRKFIDNEQEAIASHVRIDKDEETVRDSNVNRSNSSPSSELAQNKRRKLAVSSSVDGGNDDGNRRDRRRAKKRCKKKMHKQVDQLSDKLNQLL